MRTMDELWNRCHNGGISKNEWDYNRKLIVNGVEYLDDNIIKVEHSRGLMENTFSLGNTISADLDAIIIPPQTHNLSIGDLIKLQVRVETLNDGNSPWYDFGYFYLSGAEKDGERWSITAYDKLALIDTPFTAAASMSASAAISEIVSYMGVQLDSRTSITNNKVLDKLDEMNMREILGYIGSLNEGNWYITEENKLRLIKPTLSSKVWTVAPDNSKKLIEKPEITVSKVIVKTSDNIKDRFIAGSGNAEFEVFNPFGDQSLADSILARMKSYTLRPGVITSTEMNPAVELGDTIEIDGKLVEYLQVDWSTRMYANITMPTELDKFQQSFKLEQGGGEGLDELKEEIQKLTEVLGIGQCKLITPNDFKKSGVTGPVAEGGTYTHTSSQIQNGEDCVIISSGVKSGIIKVGLRPQDLTGFYLKVKGGSELTSAYDMFRGSGTTNHRLDLSELNFAKVKNSEFMFAQLAEQTHIIGMENLRTRSVTTMRSMFSRNLAIKNLTLNYNGDCLENTSKMFDRCTNLKYLDMSKVRTTSLMKNVEGMFYDCSNLIDIDVSSLRAENITNMRQMFYGCKSLKELTLPNETSQNTTWFDISSASDMSEMFYNCENLEYINFDRFYSETNITRDMKSMFRNCKKLKEVKLEKIPFLLHSVQSYSNLDNMFDGCESLNSLGESFFASMDGGGISFSANSVGGRSCTLNYTFRNTPNYNGPIFLNKLMPSFITEAFVNCGASAIYINQTTDESPVGEEFRNAKNNPNAIPIVVVGDPPLV